MFDPFDSSGVLGAYRNTKFTSGEQAGRDAAAEAGSTFLYGLQDISAAETSAKHRVEAAERASQYAEEQARKAQQAAQPSGFERGLNIATQIASIALPFA
jgi:hypothetical protein